MPTPIQTVRVIANPIAGSGRGESAAVALAAELKRARIEVELCLTSARGDAVQFAAQSKADALVSVGGDGTLSEVLRGHTDPARPIALLPLGTANVLALDLALSKDPISAARTLLAGHTVGLDTAKVNGQLSFLVCGVGFDGDAVHEVERHRRGPISKLTYIGAGLSALRRYTEPRLHVELDGERLPASFGWVLISNVIHYGGLLRLDRARKLDDGLWEVYLFERAAPRHLLLHGLRGLLGRLPCASARMRRAKRVRVLSDRPVATQIDGDHAGFTPLELAVDGPRFRIFCPKRFADA
jgi:diacylglycerol kinase family enzyme